MYPVATWYVLYSISTVLTRSPDLTHYCILQIPGMISLDPDVWINSSTEDPGEVAISTSVALSYLMGSQQNIIWQLHTESLTICTATDYVETKTHRKIRHNY